MPSSARTAKAVASPRASAAKRFMVFLSALEAEECPRKSVGRCAGKGLLRQERGRALRCRYAGEQRGQSGQFVRRFGIAQPFHRDRPRAAGGGGVLGGECGARRGGADRS